MMFNQVDRINTKFVRYGFTAVLALQVVACSTVQPDAKLYSDLRRLETRVGDALAKSNQALDQADESRKMSQQALSVAEKAEADVAEVKTVSFDALNTSSVAIKIANDAKVSANGAREVADSAKALATEARVIANDAKLYGGEANRKAERMFQKSLKK